MESSNSTLAPVALFVYNRLDNTKKVVEALRANYLASETDLFIFSDAPKKEKDQKAVGEVRKYIKTIAGFKSLTIIEREKNYYIERNIIEGVTEIVNKYGKIIVMEDDGVTAKNFLLFMNDALDFYQDQEKIMHIAGFVFIKMPEDFKKTFFWSYSENLGGCWATWKRAWNKFKWFRTEEEALSGLTSEQKNKIELDGSFKCLGTLKMKPIPWDICWYMAIVRNNGLAVNPPRTLSRNIGLYGGTHFSPLTKVLGKSLFEVELGRTEEIVFEENLAENPQAVELLKKFYEKFGKRKRDLLLSGFIKILVKLKITKLVKNILIKLKYY